MIGILILAYTLLALLIVRQIARTRSKGTRRARLLRASGSVRRIGAGAGRFPPLDGRGE